MSTPHIVFLRSVALSIVFSIAFADVIHDVVVTEDALDVLLEVVEFVSYAGVRDGSVTA